MKRTLMYQEIPDGGRDVLNIPLKLDAILYSNVCTLLKKKFIHKCQTLLWFWLSVPFQLLIGCDNKGPKAETRPEYYHHIVKWGGETFGMQG